MFNHIHNFIILIILISNTSGTPVKSSSWNCSSSDQVSEVNSAYGNVLDCIFDVNITLDESNWTETCQYGFVDTDALKSSVIPSATYYTCDSGYTTQVSVRVTGAEAYEACVEQCLELEDFKCRSIRIETVYTDVLYTCNLMSCYIGETITFDENSTYAERLPRASLETTNTNSLVRSIWLMEPHLCYGKFPTYPPTVEYNTNDEYFSGFQEPIINMTLSSENLVQSFRRISLDECAQLCNSYTVFVCAAFVYRAVLGSVAYCDIHDAYALRFQEEDDHAAIYVAKVLYGSAEPVNDASSTFLSTSAVESPYYNTIKHENITRVIKMAERGMLSSTFLMNAILTTLLLSLSMFHWHFVDVIIPRVEYSQIPQME